MAETTVNLGMLPKNRGEYSSAATYYKDNIVQYNGSSYICTATMDLEHPSGITGVAPYDSDPTQPNTGWAVFVNNQGGADDGIYDVSANHVTDNQPKVYPSLSAALNDISAAKQKGGMEIRFIFNNSDYAVDKEEGLTTQPAGTLITSSPTMVDGTYKAAQLLGYFSTLPTATGDSNAVVYYKEVDETYTTWTITLQTFDDNYVQYRLMHPLDNPSTAAADFANTDNWQGVDSRPTAGSKNLVESGGVKAAIDANNIIEGKTFYVTDGDGNVIAKIDKDGVHSVDFKIGSNNDSVAEAINGISGQISSAVNDERLLREQGDTTVTGLVEVEEARAKAVEDTKLNYTITDDKFHITDANGYIICQIDASGVHSAKDKHAVACMVLSEAYYPTSAPTRDSDGNVTYAKVMFETGVAGSISITYANGNSSSVAVVYGDYNYTITINRDIDGNVETVSVN